MKIWTVAALSAALLMGGAPSAFAQPAPTPDAAKVSPKSAELVRRLYKAAHIDTTMDSMMASMMPAITDAMTRRNPSITAEQKRLLNETVQEVMHDATPKILDRLIPAYAATFSDEELQAVVDFYESPLGSAVVRKMPLMAPKSAELMRQMLPEIETEMVTRVCAKVNCGAAPPPTPKRS